MQIEYSNLEHSKLLNSILIDMAQLRISQTICMEVLGKYDRRALKCALEALGAVDHKVDPDEYLLCLLEARPYKENLPPKLLPPKRPPTVVGKHVPGPLETMAAINQIVRKSDRETGLAALRAIRERLNAEKKR